MLDQVYPLQEAMSVILSRPHSFVNNKHSLSLCSKRTPYGLWLAVLLDLGAIASITTVAIIVLLAQTRIVYAMARDGLLPKCFAWIHKGRKTPWLATVICGKSTFTLLKQLLQVSGI